ncbi:MAG: hypothetical protein K6C95_07055, partial [Lachnospiraceae bacterium]|nr:hypothetical protein [Lachnospiraceae bacterium]
MSDNREDIKTDLIAIAKLNSIINYDDKNSISRACEIIKSKNPFRSVYGRRYHQRLQEMLAGSDYPHICITCQKPLDSSAPMCNACETAMLSGMQGSSNVTEKQNSTAAAGQVIEEKVLKGASTIKDAAAKSARSAQKAFSDLDKDKIRESAEEGTKKIKSGGLKLFSRAKNIWNDLDKKQKIIVLVITAAALIILFTLGIVRTIGFCFLIFGISGLVRLLRDIKLTDDKQRLRHRSTILKVYVPLLAAIVLILAGSKTHSGRTISGMSSQNSEGSAEDTGGLTIGVDADGVKKNIIQVGSGYYLDIDEGDKTVINNAEEATALIHKLYPEK